MGSHPVQPPALMPPSTEVPTIADSESRPTTLTRVPSPGRPTAHAQDAGNALTIIGRRWKVLIVLALPLLLEVRSFRVGVGPTAIGH